MSVWFASFCLLVVIVAVLVVHRVGPLIENQPRRILTALLVMIGIVLAGYLVLTMILLHAC